MDRFLAMLMSGVFDSAGPCALATLLIFLGVLLFLRDSRNLIWSFAVFFLLFYFSTNLILKIGWGSAYFMTIPYQVLVASFYLFVGIAFILFGGWLAYEWFRLTKQMGGSSSIIRIPRLTLHEPSFLRLLGVSLGVGSAVLAHYWPPSVWLTIASNDILLPGKLWDGAVSLVWYEAIRLWPFLVVIVAFRSFRTHERLIRILKERSSLCGAAAAGLFLGCGTSLVVIFIQRI